MTATAPQTSFLTTRHGATQSDALTSGFHRALVTCSFFLLAAAAIALRATNIRGEAPVPVLEALPDPAVS